MQQQSWHIGPFWDGLCWTTGRACRLAKLERNLWEFAIAPPFGFRALALPHCCTGDSMT